MWNRFRKLALINQLYLGFALLGLLLAFVPQDPVDITSHDTYYVIDASLIWMASCVFYLSFFGIHLLLIRRKRPIHNVVLWIHLLATTSMIISNVFFLMFGISSSDSYADYSLYNDLNSFEFIEFSNYFLTILLILFCGAQIVWLIGLLVAFGRPKKGV